MVRRSEPDFRRAGVDAPPEPRPHRDRWYANVGLLLLSVGLLTFSFAPFDQFYLAWVGLVPWLVLLQRVKSQRAAFLWSWLGGLLFFTANMWWLAYVTGPGLIALMVVLALYWGVAGLLIRGSGVLRDTSRGEGQPALARFNPAASLAPVLLIPAIWVSLEWFRGSWPLNGLPWLFLGHPQTPALAMCQVADFAGVYGVSFWVVAINALLAMLIAHRFRARPVLPAVVTVAGLLVFTLAYGLFRMSQRDVLRPGPVVMVVQSNYPQSNTGSKGATYQQLVDFHVSRTSEALRANPGVDLVIWSETMMPEMNRTARALFRGMEVGEHADYGQFLDETHERLKNLAYENKVALLVGALYLDVTREPDPTAKNGVRVLQDRRNVAYLYDRTGHMSDDPADRYDKVHIVPFGEYLPFKDTLPALHKLFVALSPYEEDYFLTAGQESAMTVFRVESVAAGTTTAPATAPTSALAPATEAFRFVTPICFEDIDPMLVAKMFRGNAGPWDKGVKRADFIVNVTNDGWFKFNEMPQHLQAARFRSIENRVPTARSVNTGISGFVDTVGRTRGLIPAGREGVSVQTLPLDRRVTLYTRLGDVFAYACVVVTLGTVFLAIVGWRRRRRVSLASSE